MNSPLVPAPPRPVPARVTGPPLLERLRMAARSRGDSQPTIENLVSWARAYRSGNCNRH